ncbi:2-methylthioadenine synthetase [Treponema primitia ZAS-2]|uniref:2-methylthioadenine synthetase n=2 Tax=Treponema primitia TaxID=88058 RepID=F5YL81_TREPZ|nr:2-methylthioadenine synthetase [Treponema primitia ZAS-2]
MVSVEIHTLGCKLNQLESESIAESFRREGFPVHAGDAAADEAAEAQGLPALALINTCTVTSKSEQKARRLIRKALKDHPQGCVIVTGCYAQVEAEAIAALETASPRRLFVVSGDNKSLLLDLPRQLRVTCNEVSHDASPDPLSPAELSRLLETCLKGNTAAAPEPSQPAASAAPGAAPEPPRSAAVPGTIPEPPRLAGVPWAVPDLPLPPAFRFNVKEFSFHSRPFLKIQDGCNHACSYCRVSIARGPSVSLDPETVLSRLRELEASGHGEAVLTGVNLNQYEANTGSQSTSLGDLLEYLLANTRTIAIRLSSLEPDCLTEPFLRVLAHDRIRPHFHLSVQSGSPLVLERMRRPYGPEAVESAIRRLRSLRDDPFLACDIITGFPGETPAEFEKTRELCQKADFAWIHAFPYSPRPGTPAYAFKDHIPEREAVSRVEALIALARQGRAAYISRQAGKTVDAIVEESPVTMESQGCTSFVSALSENYLHLKLPLEADQPPLSPGSVLRCRILEPAPPDTHFDAVALPKMPENSLSEP